MQMNVYGQDGHFVRCVDTLSLHYDDQTECTVCMCDGLFYVVDCEGDAQSRCNVGSAVPSVA